MLTKALLVFSASLSCYVMFSSPSKFGDSDARAQALAAQIGQDIKGRAGQAAAATLRRPRVDRTSGRGDAAGVLPCAMAVVAPAAS